VGAIVDDGRILYATVLFGFSSYEVNFKSLFLKFISCDASSSVIVSQYAGKKNSMSLAGTKARNRTPFGHLSTGFVHESLTGGWRRQ
jgi:hypothetical protein